MRKNRITILVFLMALFLLPSGVFATDNLITNGNFEDGTTDWLCIERYSVVSAFTGWKQRGNGDYDLSCTQLVLDPVIEGNCTGHIKGDRADGIFQYHDFNQSGNYTVSAWIYVVSGEALLGISTSGGSGQSIPTTSTGIWEYVSFTRSLTGSGGPYVYVGGEVGDFSEFYIDCLWYNAGVTSTSPFNPSTGFNPNPNPNISVSPLSHDFGSIGVGNSSDVLQINITNDGTADLNVSDIVLSDELNFSLSGETTATIEPNGSHMIEVTFIPQSVGQFDASVTVTSDDPNEQIVNIELTGEGITVPAISGCININGLPLKGRNVILRQFREPRQITLTDENGRYEFESINYDKRFWITIRSGSM